MKFHNSINKWFYTPRKRARAAQGDDVGLNAKDAVEEILDSIDPEALAKTATLQLQNKHKHTRKSNKHYGEDEASFPAPQSLIPKETSQEQLDIALGIKGSLLHRSDPLVDDCIHRLQRVVLLGTRKIDNGSATNTNPNPTTDDRWNSQIAAYELAVLLSQLGRGTEADTLLQTLGFTVKLSSQVFCATFSKKRQKHGKAGTKEKETTCSIVASSPLARAVDQCLPVHLLAELRSMFRCVCVYVCVCVCVYVCLLLSYFR